MTLTLYTFSRFTSNFSIYFLSHCDSLLLTGDVLVFWRTFAEGEVASSGVIVVTLCSGLYSTWRQRRELENQTLLYKFLNWHNKLKTLTCSIKFNTLVWPLWTLAVVAVTVVFITRESIHSKHIFRADVGLPITVLGQITLILFRATFPGARQDLCVEAGDTVIHIKFILNEHFYHC